MEIQYEVNAIKIRRVKHIISCWKRIVLVCPIENSFNSAQNYYGVTQQFVVMNVDEVCCPLRKSKMLTWPVMKISLSKAINSKLLSGTLMSLIVNKCKSVINLSKRSARRSLWWNNSPQSDVGA